MSAITEPIKLKIGNTPNTPVEEWYAETQAQLTALGQKIPIGSIVKYTGNNKLDIYIQTSNGLMLL